MTQVRRGLRSRPRGRLRGTAPFGFILALLGGCTIIDVTNGTVTERTILPGVAVIDIAPSSKVPAPSDGNAGTADDGSLAQAGNALLVEASGLGVLADQQSVTLGWGHHETIRIPDPSACQVVFVIKSANELEAARRLMNEINGGTSICRVATADARP